MNKLPLVLALSVIPGFAVAQSAAFPTKPVRMIIPFAPK